MPIVVGHDVAANLIPYQASYAEMMDELARRRGVGPGGGGGGYANAYAPNPAFAARNAAGLAHIGALRQAGRGATAQPDAGFYWDGEKNGGPDAFSWTATPEPTISGNQLAGSAQSSAFQEANRDYEPYNWRAHQDLGAALGDRGGNPYATKPPKESDLMAIRKEDRIEGDKYDAERAKEKATWDRAKSDYEAGNIAERSIQNGLGIQPDTEYDEAGTGVVPPNYKQRDITEYNDAAKRKLNELEDKYFKISTIDGLTEKERKDGLEDVAKQVEETHRAEEKRLQDLGKTLDKEKREKERRDQEISDAEERKLEAEKRAEDRKIEAEKRREYRDRTTENRKAALSYLPKGMPPTPENLARYVDPIFNDLQKHNREPGDETELRGVNGKREFAPSAPPAPQAIKMESLPPQALDYARGRLRELKAQGLKPDKIKQMLAAELGEAGVLQ